MPEPIVRVLQEDWGVFQNLPATAQRFTKQTGIKVEVTLTHNIEHLWQQMEASFLGDNPPFDVVGLDDLMLAEYAEVGGIEPLDDYLKIDGYALDDFESAALESASYKGRLYGLPYANISNVLIYRGDLFERYSVPVPQTMDELAQTALTLQTAVRKDGQPNFYGITLRGIPRCGYIFWMTGSTWCPSWSVKWFDDAGNLALDTPEHIAALEHYVSLLHRAGPPNSESYGFIECMELYRRGEAAMVIEPANEASITYDQHGSVADVTRTALIPTGPLGTRHVGLYCPPYAIPARSPVKREAWELVKFLCAPEQLVDDALKSGFVEVARRSVLDHPEFKARFHPELLETTRATRYYARGERPINKYAFKVGDILADEHGKALAGAQIPQEAVRRAQARVSQLMQS